VEVNWFSLDFWLFSYESHDEPFSDALRKLEVGFFNVVVDAATSAITKRFSTLENVGNKFGVLTNFPSLAGEELTEQCNALRNVMRYSCYILIVHICVTFMYREYTYLSSDNLYCFVQNVFQMFC